MQKISKIYVGHCGYTGAWYDGLTFDLSDGVSGLPADFILNLENGGGKTTLLGLIFSCLDTAKDRFLKHLQNKNQHFTDYFDPSGQPGFIMLEWSLPSRRVKGEHVRLVTGQVVSLRPTAVGQPESERTFFSFYVQDALTLVDVPAPKLSPVPAKSMAEFLHWLESKKTIAGAEVFHTRNQNDWQRHLQDQGIDVDLLKMQVDFSAQEGAFDTGFLNFTDEPSFLRKFFWLTLDRKLADDVLNAVEVLCKNQAARPQQEGRLAALQSLQKEMLSFKHKAANLEDAANACSAKRDLAGQVQIGLHHYFTQVQATHAVTTHQLQEFEQEVSRASQAKKQLLHQAIELTGAQHMRNTALALADKEQREKDLANADHQVYLLKGAQASLAIDAAVRQERLLEQAHRDLLSELQPVKYKLHAIGVAYRHQLHGAATNFETQRKGALQHLEQVPKNRSQIVQALADNSRELSASQRELDKLVLIQDTYLQERDRLTKDALLLPQEEVDTALSRWQLQESAHQENLTNLRTTTATLRAKRDELQRQLQSYSKELGQVASEAAQASEFLKTAEAQKLRVATLPGLLSATQSTGSVDPDYSGLSAQLSDYEQGLQRNLARYSAQASRLDLECQSLSAAPVAGVSADVRLVIQQLKAAGIRSARPFNEYIAEMVSDADTARDILLSNPARFLGVGVAASELADVLALPALAEKPQQPVVVSAFTLQADDALSAHKVIAPKTIAVINKAQATQRLTQLKDQLVQVSATQAEIQRQLTQAAQARYALDAYRTQYGPAACASATVQEATLHSRHFELEQKFSQAQSQLVSVEQSLHQNASELELAKSSGEVRAQVVKRLKAFSLGAHSTQASRLARQLEVTQMIEDLSLQRPTLEAQLAKLQVEETELKCEALRLELAAQPLREAQSSLVYCDLAQAKLADMAPSALAENLDELKKAYQAYVKTYETAEQHQLGEAKYALDQARSQVMVRKEEYAKNYAAITSKTVLAPFLELDFNATLVKYEAAVQASKEQLAGAVEQYIAAKTRQESWEQQYPSFLARAKTCPLPVDVTLVDAIHECQKQAEVEGQAEIAAQDQATHHRSNLTQLSSVTMELKYALEKLAEDFDLPEQPELEAVYDESQPIEALVAAVKQLSREYKELTRAHKQAQAAAHEDFSRLARTASMPHIYAVEPALCDRLRNNTFDAACCDVSRLWDGLLDRIAAIQDSVAAMQSDFDACSEEVSELMRKGLSLLQKATDVTVPESAPYVGGKKVLRLDKRLGSITPEKRKDVIRAYLNRLIETHTLPARGSDMAADLTSLLYANQLLGIHVLKMVPDEALQYVAINRIANSGGEGIVMAMFLYAVISRLRSDTLTKGQMVGGGPLLLDNPFAKASQGAMWKAQRLLAQAMGLQLIFTTAIQDYNALGEFNNFKRIRKAGIHSQTRRTHLELVSYSLVDEEAIGAV